MCVEGYIELLLGGYDVFGRKLLRGMDWVVEYESGW